MNYAYNHTNFESAFEVDNYPWGFRLRTKVRYWIETTSRGDRFVKRTLNPKTREWCKEKKSVYSSVMIMTKEIKDDKTFVSYESVNAGWTKAVDVHKFEKLHKDYLSKTQLKKLCECKAINEMNKHVSVKFSKSETYNLSDPADLARMRVNANSPETLAREKQQKEVKEKIARQTDWLYNQCLTKNNLN